MSSLEERAAAEEERVAREHEEYLALLRAQDTNYDYATGQPKRGAAASSSASVPAICAADETAAWLTRARKAPFSGFEELQQTFAKRARLADAPAAAAAAAGVDGAGAGASTRAGAGEGVAEEIARLEREVAECERRRHAIESHRLPLPAAAASTAAAAAAAAAAFGIMDEDDSSVEAHIRRSQEQGCEYLLGGVIRQEALRTARQAMMEVAEELEEEEEAAAAAAAAGGGVAPAPAIDRRAAFNASEAALLQRGWGGGAETEAVGAGFSVVVLRKDVRSLQDGTWLNDEVMNFWFELVRERRQRRIAVVAAAAAAAAAAGGADDGAAAAGAPPMRQHLCWNTFFCQKLMENGYCYKNVKRWARPNILRKKYPGVDSVFDFERVLLPVHVGSVHWCAAAIFLPERRIQYYDSMAGSGMAVLRALLRWLGDESRERLGEELDEEAWTLVPTQMDETPQQHNGCDCGAFTCTAADFLSNGEALSYSQADMPHFRRRMVCRILQGPGSLAAEAGLE
jgi:hypothetical protein